MVYINVQELQRQMKLSDWKPRPKLVWPQIRKAKELGQELTSEEKVTDSVIHYAVNV